eukprot:m.181653 g.181653  ORF g.181653 m.181653 type:complete len:710 (-) comp18044_c2_seq1:119-2248(-)
MNLLDHTLRLSNNRRRDVALQPTDHITLVAGHTVQPPVTMAQSNVQSRRQALDLYDVPSDTSSDSSSGVHADRDLPAITSAARATSNSSQTDAVDELLIPFVSTVRSAVWQVNGTLRRMIPHAAKNASTATSTAPATSTPASIGSSISARLRANQHIFVGVGAATVAGFASLFTFPKRPVLRRLVVFPAATSGAFAYCCPDEAAQIGGALARTAEEGAINAYRNLTRPPPPSPVTQQQQQQQHQQHHHQQHQEQQQQQQQRAQPRVGAGLANRIGTAPRGPGATAAAVAAAAAAAHAAMNPNKRKVPPHGAQQAASRATGPPNKAMRASGLQGRLGTAGTAQQQRPSVSARLGPAPTKPSSDPAPVVRVKLTASPKATGLPKKHVEPLPPPRHSEPASSEDLADVVVKSLADVKRAKAKAGSNSTRASTTTAKTSLKRKPAEEEHGTPKAQDASNGTELGEVLTFEQIMERKRRRKQGGSETKTDGGEHDEAGKPKQAANAKATSAVAADAKEKRQQQQQEAAKARAAAAAAAKSKAEAQTKEAAAAAAKRKAKAEAEAKAKAKTEAEAKAKAAAAEQQRKKRQQEQQAKAKAEAEAKAKVKATAEAEAQAEAKAKAEAVAAAKKKLAAAGRRSRNQSVESPAVMLAKAAAEAEAASDKLIDDDDLDAQFEALAGGTSGTTTKTDAAAEDDDYNQDLAELDALLADDDM